MLDIKVIRENPSKINELLQRRAPHWSIDEVLKVDEQRRECQIKADELKANRKNISQQIGIMKKNGEDTTAIQEQVRQQGEEIKALDEKQAELDELQRNLLLNIPNHPTQSHYIFCLLYFLYVYHVLF